MLAGSGVGDRPVRAPSRAKCCGMFRGIVGERAEVEDGSVLTRDGGEEVS